MNGDIQKTLDTPLPPLPLSVLLMHAMSSRPPFHSLLSVLLYFVTYLFGVKFW